VGDAVVNSPLPGCEALWQETLVMADFDPDVLAYERARNSRPAYGLTLVANYPLPDDILAGIDRLRQVCRRALGDGVRLYPDEHLHLTVYSLLRSRPLPLSDEELTVLWLRWLSRLKEVAGKSSPLQVPLRGLSVARNGAVLVCGMATDGLQRLQEQVGQMPGVAAHRHMPPHITIGQVRRPCGTVEAFGQAMAALRRQATTPVGTLRVGGLRLLYYRSRLLDEVVQSAVIALDHKG
jgi:2'-5' RNA ligase